jgi:hypothetical protein
VCSVEFPKLLNDGGLRQRQNLEQKQVILRSRPNTREERVKAAKEKMEGKDVSEKGKGML